ncbi:MAG TPA: DUF2330 domain-containing protein [Acidimicrobiales bacterium]|jgi:hypothetical protein|nr:DUF2330 domain-containing protein [Acidimicrobiales bacterium]
MRTRLAIAAALGALTIGVFAGPAAACGGLVGENGTIQLQRTTTLAAYHDGVEHYVTSFEFTGEGKEVGSIIPLPGVPTAVERGGSWTLQRLEREVAPPLREFDQAKATAAAAPDATVLYQTQIDALEITILEGGGTQVGKWAIDHGFLLTPDAPEVLDYYSQRSPIFMAARFDAAAAEERGQSSGDGTPIQLTIPTDHPWVPLRILGLGLEADRIVQADVFLLTDDRPQLLAGGRGLTLERSQAASSQLLDELRSDQNMSWVPAAQWLSYLRVDATAGDLHYDLATSVDRERRPSLVDAGLTRRDLGAGTTDVPLPDTGRWGWWGFGWWPIALVLTTVALAGAVTMVVRARPTTQRS